MSSQHPDIDAISAYVDGEAPEWTEHVAGCARCRESAATLRAVAVAVGRPVDPPSAADRDRAVAAALEAATVSDGHDAERARFAGRRSARPWAMPAVAAVVLALVAASGLILSSYRSSDETTTLAGPPAESEATTDAVTRPEGGGVAAAAPSAPPGDLGDLPDAATLRARVLGAVGGQAATDASARSATNSGSAASGSLTPTTTLSQGPAPKVVGTRPCEEQARTREPSLGPVVYFATARQGQVAGFVLGFGAVGGTATSPVTLLLLAQDDCRELLRAAGP